jgi:16S rRNA (cytosine1402-N4)-methyltransferase
MKKFEKFSKKALHDASQAPYNASVDAGGEAPPSPAPGQPHVSVMAEQVLTALRVRPGGTYIDCTLGAGGHTEAVFRSAQPGGRVLALDTDSGSIERAVARFAPYQGIVIQHGNFRDLERHAAAQGFSAVDGVVMDLGWSSEQLSTGRGFGFTEDAPLDMRYDTTQPLTAGAVVNRYPEAELARLLLTCGEEPRARQIARAIARARPIATARQLAEVAAASAGYHGGRIHPATRVFQAIRMEVNQELQSLAAALPQAVRLLAPGGRIAVISFHSLEDRVVKRTIHEMARGCICPPRLPECRCGRVPLVRIARPELWRPTPEEIAHNRRSRSARMRVAERISGG